MVSQPEMFLERINGVELCWFEWGSATPGVASILLVHATGFHARCWDQVVAHLPDRHVISIDMRGHGRSEKQGPFNWQSFGDDLTAFINHIALPELIGVGHSMGGHAVAVAAARTHGRINGLVLVDPVIMSPEIYASNESVHADWLDEAGQHPVARRKNFFESVAAMVENFKGRGSYGAWLDAVLEDYCQHGLLPNPEGHGWVLACPPLVEAEIYMGSTGKNILPEIASVALPVHVLRAKARDESRQEMDFSSSPTWPGLADFLPAGEDYHYPELTHFIPMQKPALIADHIQRLSAI